MQTVLRESIRIRPRAARRWRESRLRREMRHTLEGGNLMAWRLFTHFLAAMVGGTFGAFAMALCAASGRARETEYVEAEVDKE